MVLVGWAVNTGIIWVPGPIVIIGTIILYLCKRRIKEIVEDERMQKISDQASRRSVEIVIIIMAVVGATLLAMSSGNSTALETAGITLACSIFALLIIYSILYIFYSKKFGG